MKSKCYLLVLVVLVFVLLLPIIASAEWQTECVDCPPAYVNKGLRSLALDSSGNPHMTYGGFDGLYYAFHDGTSWHIETLNENRSEKPEIVIDSSDEVHIVYNTGHPDYTLKYVTNASGSWVTQSVNGENGIFFSMALDSSDKVHISYSSNSVGILKYVTNASGSWVAETVDTNQSLTTSIAIDSSGKVHISYYRGNFFCY